MSEPAATAPEPPPRSYTLDIPGGGRRHRNRVNIRRHLKEPARRCKRPLAWHTEGKFRMHPQSTLTPRICAHCGTTFLARSYRLGKYCSPACAHLGHRTFVSTSCAGCGAEFSAAKGKQRRFCSWSCYREHAHLRSTERRRVEREKVRICAQVCVCPICQTAHPSIADLVPVRLTPVAQRRFWSRVEKTEHCWLWTHRVNRAGYGRFNAGQQTYLAHRVAYHLAHGAIPPGLFVCHTCDVRYESGDVTYRRCVNPSHLVLGTNSDNMKQMHRAGRALPMGQTVPLRGEDHPCTTLVEADIRAIRAAAQNGPRGIQRALAERYGVSAGTICGIVKRKVWSHVE